MYLYVYHYDPNHKIKNMIWQKYIEESIQDTVDCVDIAYIKAVDISKYKVVCIDFFVMAYYNKIPNLESYLEHLIPIPNKTQEN